MKAHITPAAPYKRSFLFRSRWMDPRMLYKYHLVLQVSPSSFKVSCIRQNTHRCILLEEYLMPHHTPEDYMAALKQLYREQPLLASQEWGRITLSIANQQYALVPQHMFQEGHEEAYIRFGCPMTHGTVKSTTLSPSNVVVAFALDPSLLDWFYTVYTAGSLQVIHQASSLIQGIWTYLHMHYPKPITSIFVHVEPGCLHIIAIRKGDLLYYNRFVHKNEDEIVHYILIVMRTLQLDTRIDEVIMGGTMVKSRLSYRKACKYIRHVTLVDKAPYIRFGWFFSRAVAAQYFDVLSAHLCH